LGWLLPVTPGTQQVTVGGAIANDVHGKNHHAYGTFGHHVLAITLLRTDGEVIACTPDLRSDWFEATVGGLGLTGVICEVQLQLVRIPSTWLDTETEAYTGLAAFFALSAQHSTGWEHTVSWVDCLAKREPRGIFMRANYANIADFSPLHARARTLAITPPVSLINRASLQVMNSAYYHWHARQAGHARVHYERFFYPLDKLLGWNRLYGRKGFFQYQSVVPFEAGFAATEAMLAEIARCGAGSFLAVLKTFGERPARGLLSFPCKGVTLALDFPHQGARTRALFERLDAIVLAAGGRLYAAKNAYMSADLWLQSYPRLTEFLTYRDPGISSNLSRRLLGS
jgi:FAD/FMN-containing dehydrogenase